MSQHIYITHILAADKYEPRKAAIDLSRVVSFHETVFEDETPAILVLFDNNSTIDLYDSFTNVLNAWQKYKDCFDYND